MEVKKKRLTLDLDPPLQRRLKAVAALRGISMRQYCQTAIGKELAIDEAKGISEFAFSHEAPDRLVAAQSAGPQGTDATGDSSDQIRDVRESKGTPA